jgi:MATE family multidrug resistance protein
MIVWSFGFLRMGTVGMVSQALGKNNYQEILNIILRNLLFVLTVSVLIYISQFFILNLSLKIFDLSELTKEFYIQYFKIRIYSAPGELTLYIITGLFVGLQKTKISSLAVGFFSILNIVLSVILVTKFDLNIKGVAYGTLFSALVTSVIFLTYTFYYLKKFTTIELNITKLLDFKKIKKIFNINFNIFIRTILLTFSFLWFTYLGTQIGENYVAANAILINLVFLSAFILDAYAFSTEGMVGYSLGKKDLKLFKTIVKNSFILSTLTGIFISIIYFNYLNFTVPTVRGSINASTYCKS